MLAALSGLTACATTVTPRTVDSACAAFSTLTYSGAKAGEEKADDPGNQYDTAETVTGIAIYNARWRATCEADAPR